MSEAEQLYQLPWSELQTLAWETRQRNHAPELAFAVPGLKRYDTVYYTNQPTRFGAVSITGRRCALQCEHCRGHLLAGMHPALTPEALLTFGVRLVEQGCTGVLISGGAEADGKVPLKRYLSAIKQVKAWGLRVIVHTGLTDYETAIGLKEAGVDQVLLDIVGDSTTIREVLHLERTPADYMSALALLRDVGLCVAPHVVIGLHFGQLRGELTALDIIRQVGANVIVLVVLRPLSRTPMGGSPIPTPDQVGRLVAVARLLNPGIPVSLGCARPSGRVRAVMEHLAVLAGINGIAYPDPKTVRLAHELGLQWRFLETCCTLAVG